MQENYEEKKTKKKQEARKRCGNILKRCTMKTKKIKSKSNVKKIKKKDGG